MDLTNPQEDQWKTNDQRTNRLGKNFGYEVKGEFWDPPRRDGRVIQVSGMVLKSRWQMEGQWYQEVSDTKLGGPMRGRKHTTVRKG